ncbi:MAG: hypothetical protein EON58_07100 [Alphaproteobacteria bacterium]|nr:MAG: hypothetical protein EON58_07100 [Alphaproteobacteria bacterium]
MFKQPWNGRSNGLAFFRALKRPDPSAFAAPFIMALVDAQIAILVRTSKTYETIFTDPRPIQAGKWHRFDVALRFGAGQYGLAQVEHNGALVASYCGALG